MDHDRTLCIIADGNEQEYIIGIEGLEIIIEDPCVGYRQYFTRITNIIVDTSDIVELEIADISKELEYEDTEDITDEKLIRIMKK